MDVPSRDALTVRRHVWSIFRNDYRRFSGRHLAGLLAMEKAVYDGRNWSDKRATTGSKVNMTKRNYWYGIQILYDVTYHLVLV